VGLLGALYFAQGMPYGFQSKALPVYLRSHGVSVLAITVLEVLALPWMLKALWAPLVDRYGSERVGRRKSWIIPMQLGLVLTCVAAAFVPLESELPLLLGLVFLMNLFAATQDIAVDGFAVDLLEPQELGGGNSAQVMGYKLGMLTAGGLLVWMIDLIHWRGLFLAMAALCLLVLGVVLLTREPRPRVEEGAKEERLSWAELRDKIRAVLLLPGTVWMLLFIGTYKLGETMVDVLFKLFLIDAGFKVAQIGQWVGTWGTVASLIGSAAGGLLATRMPVLGAVALASCLRVFPLGWEWWLAHGDGRHRRHRGGALLRRRAHHHPVRVHDVAGGPAHRRHPLHAAGERGGAGQESQWAPGGRPVLEAGLELRERVPARHGALGGLRGAAPAPAAHGVIALHPVSHGVGAVAPRDCRPSARGECEGAVACRAGLRYLLAPGLNLGCNHWPLARI
jgi:MFS family permease